MLPRLSAGPWITPLRIPLGWLLPPRCGGCRRLGDWLCESCQRLLRRLQEPLCPRCGCELEFESANCGCRDRLRALTGARSAAAYEGPLERAIHRFKYEGWRCLAPTLSNLIAERLALDGLSVGLLLSVPLHPSRLRHRGYNQAELLARELRRQLELRLGASAQLATTSSARLHADEILTRSLKSALALVDVQVLDHFIVAGTQAISFAERGLL